MTQINYPDLTRSSPSGEFILEIRSPDNDPASCRDDSSNSSRRTWGGFQRDFTFSVRRPSTGEIVWKRGPDHDSLLDRPADAWISDQGQAIILTKSPFSGGLFVLDHDGEIRLQFDVLSDLLDNNDDELQWTSAGPFWNERGFGLFFQAKSSYWWCFRTRLLRQIVINLTEMRLKADEDIEAELHEAQSTWAIQTTRNASKYEELFGLSPDEEWRAFFESDEDDAAAHQARADRNRYYESVWAAIYWCGVDKLTDSIASLQKLEESTVFQSYRSGWSTPTCHRTWFVKLTLVPVCQMALRCMNHQPIGIAGYWLCDDSCSPSQKTRIAVPERISDRSERLEAIRPGMTQCEVTEHVGMPDAGRRTWDYDVLADAGSYTLRIKWDEKDRVQSLCRCPPAWYEPASRSTWL